MLFLQRRGVCIGSKVAPVLSNIFFSFVDRAVNERLQNVVSLICRYVDDYLVVVKSDNFAQLSGSVMQVFEECGYGLKFTMELPCENKLQFLDLQLKFEDDHVCWRYNPRTGKPLLDYGSGHSKLIKNGVAFACLRAALSRSCHETLLDSFLDQVDRLRKARYPDSVLIMTAKKLIRWVKSQDKGKDADGCDRSTQEKVAVIPYVHKMSHGLKKVARRFGVKVAFSAPVKTGTICAAVQRKVEGTSNSKQGCGIKHDEDKCAVPCATEVVYNIPLSCGAAYIGQTGRCLNTRLNEHKSAVKKKEHAHLAAHCKECACISIFTNTSVLFRHRSRTIREIMEAFLIGKGGENCISQASLNLLDKEIRFLEGT